MKPSAPSLLGVAADALSEAEDDVADLPTSQEVRDLQRRWYTEHHAGRSSDEADAPIQADDDDAFDPAAMRHGGDEWYVIVLDDEALARMDLRRDPWPADEEPN